MRKVIVVVVVVVLLLLLLFTAYRFGTMRGTGQGGSENPGRLASGRFQPGDTAVVMADNVDLREGDTTVARLGKECRLTVLRVSQHWVGGTVQSGGKTLTGWVDERYLAVSDALPEAGGVEPSHVEPAVSVRVVVVQDPAELSGLQSQGLIDRLIIAGEHFSSESLQPLSGLRVLSLSIEAANVGSSALQYVSQVQDLRELRLWTPDIYDAGLEFVARMKTLERLDLEGTSVRGAGLARLQELPRLSHVTLGPMTTAEELASLQTLPHLTELDLRACYQLTEACLRFLADVKTLRVLWLPRHLSDTADAQIRQALPDCEVRRPS